MDPNTDILTLAAEIEARLDRATGDRPPLISTEARYQYIGLLLIAKAIVAAAVHCDQELITTDVRSN